MSHMETKEMSNQEFSELDEQAPEPPSLIIAPKALFQAQTAILNCVLFYLTRLEIFHSTYFITY